MKHLLVIGFAVNVIAGMLAWTIEGRLETAFFHFLIALVLIWMA